MKPVEPIFVAELFLPLHDELLSLLRGLTADDWLKPTIAPGWIVKDIVAHLLDTDIRRLSMQGDKRFQIQPDPPIKSYRDLVDFLNRLNADWVKAAKRISPQLLIDFLAVTGTQVSDLFKSRDPFAPAPISVAWAGEEQSFNWFDIAREYTEKWHHQQQIRDAVGAADLMSRKWLFPVLDTFLRGLPHTYRHVAADDGTLIAFIVSGEAGGEWTLSRESGLWRLYAGASHEAACSVKMSQDTAWRLMTRGLSSEEAAARVTFSGNRDLGASILGMLAVMA